MEHFEDGDIYLNPFFGDLWIVNEGEFVKINDGYRVEVDIPEGFVKVGHADVLSSKKTEDKQ